MPHTSKVFGEDLARDVVWLIAAALGVWWLWSKFGSQIQNAINVRQNTKATDSTAPSVTVSIAGTGGAGSSATAVVPINPTAVPNPVTPQVARVTDPSVGIGRNPVTPVYYFGYDPALFSPDANWVANNPSYQAALNPFGWDGISNPGLNPYEGGIIGAPSDSIPGKVRSTK